MVLTMLRGHGDVLQSGHRVEMPTPSPMKAGTAWQGPLVLVLLLAIGVGVVLFTDFRPERLRQAIQSVGVLAPLLYVLLYTVSCVVMIPASILSLTGGLAFGPVWGTLFAVIGAMLGASAAFFVARRLGRETVARLIKGRLVAFDETAARHGFRVILFMRIVPVFPFIGVNYGAGLSRISFADFFLATLIAIVPGTFAFNLVGSSLTNIYSRQFVSAVLILAIVMGGPILYRLWQGKRIFTLKP